LFLTEQHLLIQQLLEANQQVILLHMHLIHQAAQQHSQVAQ